MPNALAKQHEFVSQRLSKELHALSVSSKKRQQFASIIAKEQNMDVADVHAALDQILFDEPLSAYWAFLIHDYFDQCKFDDFPHITYRHTDIVTPPDCLSEVKEFIDDHPLCEAIATFKTKIFPKEEQDEFRSNTAFAILRTPTQLPELDKVSTEEANRLIDEAYNDFANWLVQQPELPKTIWLPNHLDVSVEYHPSWALPNWVCTNYTSSAHEEAFFETLDAQDVLHLAHFEPDNVPPCHPTHQDYYSLADAFGPNWHLQEPESIPTDALYETLVEDLFLIPNLYFYNRGALSPALDKAITQMFHELAKCHVNLYKNLANEGLKHDPDGKYTDISVELYRRYQPALIDYIRKLQPLVTAHKNEIFSTLCDQFNRENDKE